MRLFLALEPPAAFRRAVAGRVEEVRGSLPAASWVREANLHLTLLFLGEVEDAALDRVAGTFAAVRAPALAGPVSVEGAGGFPEGGAIRAVWLALAPADGLAAVARAFRAAASAARIDFDAKPFRAHLTLARCHARWPAALRERLGELVPSPPPSFRPDSASLLSSVLGPGGSTYTVRARVPLAEAA